MKIIIAACLLFAPVRACAAEAVVSVRFEPVEAVTHRSGYAENPDAGVLKKWDKAPAVDGKIEDAWNGMFRIERFVMLRREAVKRAFAMSADGRPDEFMEQALKPTQRTEAFLAYDDEALWIACRGYENAMEKMVHEPTGKRDAAVWGGDCVELFVDDGKDASVYYHVIVDYRGTVYDAVNRRVFDARPHGYNTGKFKSDRSWNPTFDAKTFVGDGFWSIEMRVPFGEIGVVPGEGGSLRLNLAREEQPNRELSSWAPCETAFHERERFATVYFGHRPQRSLVVREVAFADPGYGTIPVDVSLENVASTGAEATVRLVLVDGQGATAAQGERTVRADGGKRARAQWSFPAPAPGNYALVVNVAAATARRVLDEKRVALAVPALLEAELAGWEFFSDRKTVPLNVRLHVRPDALKRCGLRVTLAPEGGDAVAESTLRALSTAAPVLAVDISHLQVGKAYVLMLTLCEGDTTLAVKQFPVRRLESPFDM